MTGRRIFTAPTIMGRRGSPLPTGFADPAIVNAVREDRKRKGLLYAGTEFGVTFSVDDGGHWQPLKLNLPVTSVRDLAVHGDDLVIATHGRSFWILDDITPLRQASERSRSKGAFLYKPETAVRVDNDGFPGTPLPPEEPTARTRQMARSSTTICPAKRTKSRSEFTTSITSWCGDSHPQSGTRRTMRRCPLRSAGSRSRSRSGPRRACIG